MYLFIHWYVQGYLNACINSSWLDTCKYIHVHMPVLRSMHLFKVLFHDPKCVFLSHVHTNPYVSHTRALTFPSLPSPPPLPTYLCPFNPSSTLPLSWFYLKVYPFLLYRPTAVLSSPSCPSAMGPQGRRGASTHACAY